MKKQFNSLLVLSTALLAIAALAGCQKSGQSSSQQSESGSSGEKTYSLSAVNQNANYAKYLSNIAIDSSRDDGFKVRTNPFRVGDDNPFKFKPVLTVIDTEELEPASESNWTNPFTITVEVENAGSYAAADAALYEILDDKECIIQFKEGAAGKNFRITVAPTGVPEARLAGFTKTLTFTVVDGYNVYDAKELGYLDTRTGNVDGADREMALTAWRDFKEANGMDVNLKPTNFILQHDTVITKDDIPADALYPASAHGVTYANTMRDWNGLIRLQQDKTITLYGNYFQLNYSQLPLITYYSSGNHVNSHSMLFDVSHGTFNIQDINVTGNAKYATEDGEDKYAGGLMLAKVRQYAEAVNADNVIAREAFITFMGEGNKTTKGYVDFRINDCKFSNNYNSFLYNWGGKMFSTNTDFVKCGGPIVIQDHTDVGEEEPHETEAFVPNGHPPYTEFNNCKLENYVAGSEGWFVQFGVTALVGQIKQMSDFYYANGLSYVVDSKEHKAMLSTAATPENPSVFNLIAVNKSGSSESETALPVCGEVIINHDETVEDFNYSQPTQEQVVAYVTLSTFMAEQEAAVEAYAGGDEGAALAALFTKWGFQPESMDPEAIQAAITAKALELQEPALPTIYHSALRTINANGAPVFETTGGFGYYNPLTCADAMQPIDNAILELTDPMEADDPFVTGANDYTAIYYNGMMLIMGLTKVATPENN